MSGPKGVSYRVVPESELRETALRNWRLTSGNVEYFCTRARALGHPDLTFTAGAPPSGSSTDVNAAQMHLQSRLDEAQRELDARLMQERNRRIEHDLQHVLEQLAREEEKTYRAAAHDRHHQANNALDPSRETEKRTRIAEQVARRLHRLIAPSSELEARAKGILQGDVDRAPMLLDDLDSRISAFNRTTEQIQRDRQRLDALRNESEVLPPTPALEALLRHAARETENGRTTTSVLDNASQLVTSLLEQHRAERNRKFVLESVTASLENLGYTVSPVDVEEAHTVVLQRAGNGGHGIRAHVTADEINLRTVAFDDTEAVADKAADEALCSALDPLLDSLNERGIEPGRIRRPPAGLVSPQHVRRSTTIAAGNGTRQRQRRPAERNTEGGR